MCPTKLDHRTSSSDAVETCSQSGDENRENWRDEAINGGSLKHVDLQKGTNGWASPPGDLFVLRSKNFFIKKQKSPSGDWLLKPAGVDWLRSASKLENVLARSDNRVANALKKSQSLGKSLKSFIFAVNLQVPGRENHSAVFYFATEEPIPVGSLFYRFVHGDDAFRNQRFKIVNRIVKGPWIVKAAVGNYAACLLGKALTCNYYRGENYLEIDVDIGSSAIATAILHLALGYVTAVTIDMGFLVEAQTEEELPEKLLGAVRIAHMEMSSATFVETSVTESIAPVTAVSSKGGKNGCRGIGLSKVNHHQGHMPVTNSTGLNEEDEGDQKEKLEGFAHPGEKKRTLRALEAEVKGSEEMYRHSQRGMLSCSSCCLLPVQDKGRKEIALILFSCSECKKTRKDALISVELVRNDVQVQDFVH